MRISIYHICFSISFRLLDISFDSNSRPYYSFGFSCFHDDFGYPKFLIEFWKFTISSNSTFAAHYHTNPSYDDIPF